MKRIIAVLLAILTTVMICGCHNANVDNTNAENNDQLTDAEVAGLGEKNDSFGESFEDLNLYGGYFEEDIVDVSVEFISGSEGCYTLEGNTLTFTNISKDSVYSVSGKLKGNIVIDVGDEYKFDLELTGFSLVCSSTNPITVLSGDEVSLTAKKETENYIYDKREVVDDFAESEYSGSVYSMVDLEVCGKGSLAVVSENNNGIHTKDDLQIKNLNLTVACVDNALKGNDSVEFENATTTLIATAGDGVKTSNSDISENGKQRGTVTVSGGKYNIFAACDGIDAAYNVVVDGAETELNIYTDKYSNYSAEVTAVDDESNYIRFITDAYKYSVKYYNSDEDYCFVDAQYHSKISDGRNNYYYYSFPKMKEYNKMQFFIYSEDMSSSQDEEYLAASDYLSINEGYDTLALESYGNRLTYNWTNYTTTIQDNGMGGRPGGMGPHGGMGGFGGMNEGNTDKGEYSTKGIKSANEIFICDGSIVIKSYDDSIHANNDTELENGETSKGNITVSGGVLTVFSNDDGIHADGILQVSGGLLKVTNSYEGLEGAYVIISGGNVSVVASDDGINATIDNGTAVEVSDGTLYVFCCGDGIDSNSRTSYSGIVFSGGNTVIISNSGGNSAIDTEQGYKYDGGSVVAVMPRGAMTNEVTHCADFQKVASNANLQLNKGDYLTVSVRGESVAVVKIPVSISAIAFYLGSSSASIQAENLVSSQLDSNGVWFK